MSEANTRRHAEQGDSSSQFALGFLYFDGKSIPRDLAQAAYWFKKAAEQGHARAQYNLATCYGRPMGSGRTHPQPEPKTVSFRRISVQQSKGTA
jgi:TPR repeat protein